MTSLINSSWNFHPMCYAYAIPVHARNKLIKTEWALIFHHCVSVLFDFQLQPRASTHRAPIPCTESVIKCVCVFTYFSSIFRLMLLWHIARLFPALWFNAQFLALIALFLGDVSGSFHSPISIRWNILFQLYVTFCGFTFMA
jgi:hypothetical protein